jgi:hypothetical protein
MVIMFSQLVTKEVKMSTQNVNIHIFDKAKYKTYQEARSENAIYNYDASDCADRPESGLGCGMLYEIMHVMSLALAMVEQADRLGAVLVVDGLVVDTW